MTVGDKKSTYFKPATGVRGCTYMQEVTASYNGVETVQHTIKRDPKTWMGIPYPEWAREE